MHIVELVARQTPRRGVAHHVWPSAHSSSCACILWPFCCFRSRKLAFRNLPASLIFRALRSANNFAEGDEDLCRAKAVSHLPAAWSPCGHSCSYINVHSLTFCFRSLKLILIVMFFLVCLCVLMSFRRLAEVARETHSAQAVALHRPAYACVHTLTFCFRSSKGFKHRYI